MRAKLTKRGTAMLAKDLCAGLSEGATLEVVLGDDRLLELRPEAGTDPSQAWLWSPRWQEMEREAEGDFASGEYDTFDGVEAFLSELDAHAEAGDNEPTDRRR
jgi:hypothetical protein